MYLQVIYPGHKILHIIIFLASWSHLFLLFGIAVLRTFLLVAIICVG